MAYTMSQACVPPLEIGLNALSDNLDKATAFAAAKKIEPTVLTQWRLAPDMFPLARQVQIACDLAKNGAARLAGRFLDHSVRGRGVSRVARRSCASG